MRGTGMEASGSFELFATTGFDVVVSLEEIVERDMTGGTVDCGGRDERERKLYRTGAEPVTSFVDIDR